MSAKKEFALYVIGLGIPELNAMTMDAWAAMKSCKVLFVNDPQTALLKEACADLRPIGDLGNAAGDAGRKRLIARVLSVAEKYGPAGLALYGHPMIYEPVTTELARAGKKKGLRVRVVPGISAFDAILADCDLALEIGTGTVLSDARHFLAGPPNARCTTILYRAFYPDASLAEIAAHCRGAYPAGHRAALVEAANWHRAKELEWVRLEDLPKKAAGRSMYTTVVIPPA